MQFVCDSCRAGNHELCRGGSWCDCLHRAKRRHMSKASANGCPECTVALRVEVSSMKLLRNPTMPDHRHGKRWIPGRLLNRRSS